MAEVLIIATNYGTWAGNFKHNGTLARKPALKLRWRLLKTNPDWVYKRCKELVDGDEWAHPNKFADINMDDYDAIAMAGGSGVTLDLCQSRELHQAVLKAIKSDKIVETLCYAVTALVFCRDPENDYKSVIYGKKITARPRITKAPIS